MPASNPVDSVARTMGIQLPNPWALATPALRASSEGTVAMKVRVFDGPFGQCRTPWNRDRTRPQPMSTAEVKPAEFSKIMCLCPLATIMIALGQNDTFSQSEL